VIQFVINLSSLVRWVLLSCKSMVLELVPYLTHTVAKMNIDGNYWWIDVRLQLIIKIIITVSPVTNWTIWVWQVEHITESIIAIEGDSLASLLRNKETWKQEKKKHPSRRRWWQLLWAQADIMNRWRCRLQSQQIHQLYPARLIVSILSTLYLVICVSIYRHKSEQTHKTLDHTKKRFLH